MDDATAPQVAILSGKKNDIPDEILEQVFRFRFKVFYQRLGWDIPHSGDMETDEYDEHNPLFSVALIEGQVVGTMRFLPTTGPYMLDETFPVLLNGEQAPSDSRIWEISRFSVDNTAAPRVDNQTIFLTMIHYSRNTWGREIGLRELVLATTVPVERIMRHRKLPISRFGNGNTHQIGGVKSVGCRLMIDEQFEATCKW